MLLEAGGRVLYHSFVCGVERNEENITGVTVCGKDGMKKLTAKVYIDASGDADVSRFAGLPTRLGRKEDHKCQPVTLNMKLYNVDTEKVREYIRNNPEDFPRMDVSLIDNATRVSVGGYNTTFAKAIEDGEITFDREFLLFFETNNEGEVIVNTTRVSNINPLKPEELTKAEMAGRNLITEKYGYMMERTSPAEFAAIRGQLPARVPEKDALIDQICAQQTDWQEQLAERYPKLTGRGRSIRRAEDTPVNTSFETYMWGELATYSVRTIQIYADYVEEVRKEGKSIPEMVLLNTVKQYGFDSLDAAEARMR